MTTVNWSKQAISDLTRLSMDHLNQWADIDAAEQDISGKLGRNPLQHSHEVSEGLYRIISWPLVGYFYFADEKQIVVDAVGWIG